MQKMRKLMTDNSGFTLIELLVVIAVLGILAAIAIPRLGGVTNKARLTEAKTAASTLRQAQEMYYTEESSYTSTSSDLFEYVDSDTLPSGWDYKFETSSSAQAFTITIDGDGTNNDDSLGVQATNDDVVGAQDGSYDAD